MKIIDYLKEEDNCVVLDLSRQKLTTVPQEIKTIAESVDKKYKGKTFRWKEINLSYNSFNELRKEDFQLLNYFDMIHLVGLNLKEISCEIKHLTNPIVINFSFSELVSLPKEIYSLKKLKSIRINWTKIANFDIEIKNLNLVDVEVSETPFIHTIHKIAFENNGQPETEHEKKVWEVKKILDDMGCEIEE